MATLNGPAEIVEDKYQRSIGFAENALATTDDFRERLADSIYKPPQLDVQWSTLAAPNLPPIPRVPELPELSIEVPAGMPGAFTKTIGSVAIDAFDIPAPALNFPPAPTLTIGTAPVLPTVRDVAIPDAPDVVLPEVPEFLVMSTHAFNGVDLHEDWLTKLENIPELSLLEPAPFKYTPGAKYASALLESLKANLNARINGGTGLAPAVEQQIWDRSRDRETQIALAREKDVSRAAEALGFTLPSGVFAGQLADARRDYYDKLSGLSRDIAIKQADLEQQNLKDAITAALQLETVLMDDLYKHEQLAFEAAKTAAELALSAHNAAIEKFKTLLVAYQAYAAAYDTIIKAELSKVEVFKALLSAEEIKASINKALVDRYKAEIEGRMAVVEIYKSRVGAAQTLVELERTRITAGGEEVKAFVATINAETAKAELHKAVIGAETAKQEAHGSQVRAYAAKVGAQAETARANVAVFQAHLAAKGLEWDGWKARLGAAVSVAEIKARSASIVVDGYKLGASAAEAQATSYMRRWEAEIHQYSAGLQVTYNVAKANHDAIIHANDARIEANKVMMTTAAQQVASSWAMVNASASISGTDTTVRQQ